MIERFIQKLVLPFSSKVIVNSVTKLNDLVSGTTYFEGYHVFRNCYSPKESLSLARKICKEGFLDSAYGNKGMGVYLSSHSSYGLRWVGQTPGMLVCYVKIENQTKMKRFVAEVPPGYEYVANCDIVIPGYLIDYNVIGSKGNIKWLKLGESGCERCDSSNVRCDCPLEPSFHPNENIITHL